MWEENVDSVDLFALLSTQWRFIAGLYGVMETGLDYTAVRSLALALHPGKRLKQLMRDIMDMEAAALSFFAEVRS